MWDLEVSGDLDYSSDISDLSQPIASHPEDTHMGLMYLTSLVLTHCREGFGHGHQRPLVHQGRRCDAEGYLVHLALT